TRLMIEDASGGGGVKSLAALAGTGAGGGYELALACDEIVLTDDGSSAVSLPEVPLLGVLPGTGGLTRLVDKRRVRRDLADVFCTLAEGVRGKRAEEWALVDRAIPKSRFDQAVVDRAKALAAAAPHREGPGGEPRAIEARRWDDGDRSGSDYRGVPPGVARPARAAELPVPAPEDAPPDTPAALRRAGAEAWALAVSRELDDALLDLRFNRPE